MLLSANICLLLLFFADGLLDVLMIVCRGAYLCQDYDGGDDEKVKAALPVVMKSGTNKNNQCFVD